MGQESGTSVDDQQESKPSPVDSQHRGLEIDQPIISTASGTDEGDSVWLLAAKISLP
jgi:hypothetical protein